VDSLNTKKTENSDWESNLKDLSIKSWWLKLIDTLGVFKNTLSKKHYTCYTRTAMKKIFKLLLLIIIVLSCIALYNTFTVKSCQITKGGERLKFELNHDAIAHLQKAIHIPTISYDDPSKLDTIAFLHMLELLDSMYPITNAQLEKTIINSFSIIYHWRGKTNTEKPAILYAHLDVVPVETVNRDEWLHDPWAGDTAEGFIWGRGTLDDKGSAISIMESVEQLLAEGFQPENDVYFLFGHDEEVGGKYGAAEAAKFFKSKGIKTRFNLDEGGMCTSGMIPFISKPVILIGTAEKGYMTLKLTSKMKRGHSSKPEKETSIKILTKALARLDDFEFPKEISPVLSDFIDYVGPEMALPARIIFTNKWLFKPIILAAYENAGSEGSAVTKTTHVTTLLNAGVKENLIPGEATAIVNFRLLPGNTVESVISKVKEVIADERILIEDLENTIEASPVTAVESYGFKKVQQVSAEVFPDAIVSPFLMIGATDSKHFTDISESLIRCLPVRMTKDQLRSVHGVNEKIGINDYMEMISFYKTLIKQI
jgi:carboxypeptidase PM20D1